jgi:hypothetical protein
MILKGKLKNYLMEFQLPFKGWFRRSILSSDPWNNPVSSRAVS